MKRLVSRVSRLTLAVVQGGRAGASASEFDPQLLDMIESQVKVTAGIGCSDPVCVQCFEHELYEWPSCSPEGFVDGGRNASPPRWESRDVRVPLGSPGSICGPGKNPGGAQACRHGERRHLESRGQDADPANIP